ncbi:hypothetical protein [Pseudomonas putida]|uniref:hypothetical protein n=1 Tax=Pseudomonas putida TaxID=303 RepID=UPI000629FC25|nr:hypothetical protein [Pseudomonas putida]
MDTNKMRAEFEAAFVEEEVRLLGEGFRSSALYMIEQNTVNVRSAWWAWKASREAVVVELPELRSVPDRDCWARTNGLGFNNALKEARQVIEAKGLKVAP